MTTATLTETGVLARAAAVLSRCDEWLDRNQSFCAQEVRNYGIWLREDIATFHALNADPSDPENIHPTSVYPDLEEGWPDDALGQALDRITRDIADGTGALIEITGRYCGSEAAEYVAGGEAE